MKKTASPRLWCIVLTALFFTLLCAQFTINLDNGNTRFADFQQDSQELVLASLNAGRNNQKIGPYGLGLYTKMELYSGDSAGDEARIHAGSTLALNGNAYAEAYLQKGNFLKTPDGAQYTIIKAEQIGDIYYVDFAQPLAEYPSQEALDTYTVLFADGTAAPDMISVPYYSLVGLQGWICYWLGRIFPVLAAHPQVLEIGFALLSAVTLCAITCAIQALYANKLLTFCFAFTFLTAPWVVNMARNLYWCLFLLFLPMLIGLLYCLQPQKRFRFILLSFLSIFLKCLCGFEFTSTVMLGLMLFPIAKLMTEADKSKRKRCFFDILYAGLAAVAAFVAVFLLLSFFRGDGNLLQGISNVFREDILRRTLIGDASQFSGIVAASIDASIISVLVKYFLENLYPLVAGIGGNLFPFLAAAPIFIFLFNKATGKTTDKKAFWLYLVSLAAALSWLVLGKSHSYIHVHINFILWYFGFVQMCLYIPANFIRQQLSRGNIGQKDEM